MTHLTPHTPEQVMKKLKRAGFIFDRQAKGSHEIWYNPQKKLRTTIPNHPGRPLPLGTLKAILKQADITTNEFMNL